ncbi:MAG: peptidoglycan bridge formation glycyltransferase FemA/FemB family protein [Oscillospiraceae bacterium]|nr:peptidoglycan bridge formation glycyltransferase FemA/FemB family protein [Oscillospiraceae bacterium]
MKLIADIERERYESFVREHPSKSHFMQSAAWGDFSAKSKGLEARLIGIESAEGELRAAALLLGRKPPLFPKYYYCPRGPVLDYGDGELLAETIALLKEFAEDEGAMFLKFDPDIVLFEHTGSGALELGGGAILEQLKALGCVHHGFNKEFEGRQPRYTFRIDLSSSDEEIDRRIVGNVLKNVKKSRRYACEVAKGASADIPKLHELISITSERDDFVGYPESYYRDFFDTLSANGMAALWLGRVDPAASVEMLKEELAALLEKRKQLKKEGPLKESELSEARLLREIAAFESYAREFPKGAVVSAHLVVNYGDKAWAVHAGSDTKMSETFINNRVYYEKIHAAKAAGARLLDQFGTVGDPENSSLKSLHEFKKQFGGRYLEFIGEFDIAVKPCWHLVYERALPLYRRARIGLKLALRGRKGE